MKVSFENATVADVIAKAARVAPTKGEAFDKASGILVELDEEEGTCTIRSTNLDLWYLEVVDTVTVEGTGMWLFHAGTLAGVMAKLPIGSGKTVTLEQTSQGEVSLKSGRTTAKFRVRAATYYPTWEPFDPEALEVVPDLGARIKQVEWAAETSHSAPSAGIHMDGEHVIATDRIRMAMVECEAKEVIYKPITIPAGILKPIMTNLRDVAVGIDDGMFLMMPDVSTQIKTRIYDRDWPNVKAVFTRFDWNTSAKVKKAEILEIIDRATVMVAHDRSPKLDFIIGKGEIAVMCSDVDMGLLGDIVDISGYADHPRHKVPFTPKNLVDALAAAPSEEIEVFYNLDHPEFPFKIDGGSGFVALVMPRKDLGT